MPGLVPTAIAAPTFGKNFVAVVMWLKMALKVAISPEQCALNHLNIMSAAAATVGSSTEVKVGLWDHYLVGRTANDISADPVFRNWLWERLDEIVKTRV